MKENQLPGITNFTLTLCWTSEFSVWWIIVESVYYNSVSSEQSCVSQPWVNESAVSVSIWDCRLILKGGNCIYVPSFSTSLSNHTTDVDFPGDSERHVPVEVSDMHLQLPGPICVAAIRHPYTVQRHPLETASKPLWSVNFSNKWPTS